MRRHLRLASFGVDARAMTSLSAGQLAADLVQGAPPALLVFLVPKLGLSYAMAASVVLAATLSSSVVQPAFGLLSDRRGAIWLLALGVAVGGVGVGLAAVAPAYDLLLLCVFASGLGVAAFHPEAAKFASYVSGKRRASGMALFMIAGNAGIAVGPILTSTVILAFGLRGGLLLIAPALLAAALLVGERRHLESFVPTIWERHRAASDGGQRGALALLIAVGSLRSVAYFGVFTFVPLWEVAKGATAAEATRLLAYVLAAGGGDDRRRPARRPRRQAADPVLGAGSPRCRSSSCTCSKEGRSAGRL